MQKCMISDDNTSSDILGLNTEKNVLNKNRDISNNTSVVVDIEFSILCEILSRLPVKSLMRFKFVSKTWLSLIQKDLYFIDLHCKRSRTLRPALLYVIPLKIKDQNNPFRVGDKFFLTANLSFERRGKRKAEIHSTRKINLFTHRLPADVRIYNISTREVTPRITSTLLREEVEKNSTCWRPSYDITYKLGFHPATKEHKLLCMCRIYLCETDYEYELYQVLTVGDNTWRRIDWVSPCRLDFLQLSVYANGSIYFCSAFFEDGDPKFLVVFDVGSEKFRTIPIPFILDHQPLDSCFWMRRAYLLAVDGHVAILRRMNNRILKLWIYKATNLDDAEANWSEDIITLPFSWDRKRCLSFSNVEGTNQIIMEFFGNRKRRVNSVYLYSYDWKKKTFCEVKVGGIPASVPDFCSVKLFTAFAESLFPVQKTES
ncbi:putative F-box protein At1g32420 [Papaver somniferum]|uniref:putative F-box protein At1g32420 n=1 Tax=Papaver somniferum TaxID=3469 RepID=UPI000E6FA5EC|nr:putative F-box protein At1g32420 [Papaver somniferum]